jgi:hypothetical protein
MIVDALLLAEPTMHLAKKVLDPKEFMFLDDEVQGEIERRSKREPDDPVGVFLWC